MDKATIGERIREVRTRNGWTLVQVAEWSGIDHTAISRYEADSHAPNAENIARLARGLRVSSDWLLGIESQVDAT